MENEIQKKLEWYCGNEMFQLKKMCYPMLIKIGGISDKDYDDFYSVALSVLSDTALRYDENNRCNFDSFLASNIKRKFITEIRDRNRDKRVPAKKLESTSNLVTEDGMELGETIPSKFNTFDVACEYLFDGTKIERYLDKLSHTQRKIVSLLSDGYKASEIRELLHMSSKEYSQNLAAIQAYENVRELM
jgi:DNA-directed RNA polymerase specialized sigma subunit